MRKIFLIFLLALTNCAIIYSNKSFLYKSEHDWASMTLKDVEKIVQNGGDINEENIYGYTPLRMACKYNLSLDVIKFMIEKGANPSECILDEYIGNVHIRHLYKTVISGTSTLLALGVPPSLSAEGTLLDSFPAAQENIIKLFKQYNTYPSKAFLKHAITRFPMKYKDLKRMYDVNATDKEIALWRIKSPSMQEKRNTKEWYDLVTQVKKLGANDGFIGISKSNYITTYGVPDKEYKVNSQTTILVYTQENRYNVPITAYTNTSSYGTAEYNKIFDNIQTNSHGSSYTHVSGGYMKVSQWQQNVYIDNGIVTGIQMKDKIITH